MTADEFAIMQDDLDFLLIHEPCGKWIDCYQALTLQDLAWLAQSHVCLVKR